MKNKMRWGRIMMFWFVQLCCFVQGSWMQCVCSAAEVPKPCVTADSSARVQLCPGARGCMWAPAKVHVWCALLGKRSRKCFGSISSASEIVIFHICRGGLLQLEALVPAVSPWSKFLVRPGELFPQAWCIHLFTLWKGNLMVALGLFGHCGFFSPFPECVLSARVLLCVSCSAC